MQIPKFGTAAPKLAENGYQPVPIHWRKKNPCAGKEWQNYVFAESDCSRFSDAGTGLLCGKIIGVDIDVRDARLSQEIEKLAEELLGPAPRRIGQAPKVLRVYQADAPFSKRATRGYRLPGDAPDDKSHRVEVLAKGQQFVAYNIHEKTGEPYVWNGFGDPLTVPIGLLPSVSEAQTIEFLRRAEELLGEYGSPVGKLIDEDDRAKHEPNEKQQPDDTATFIAALDAIPNDDLEYDDWCRVLYAVKGALGDNGLKAFLDWSAKSSKDVPTFSTREFLSARPTRIGAGTIFRLARSRGWQWPRAPQPEPDDWPDPVNIFAELSAPPFIPTDAPPELAAYPFLYAEQTGIDASIALMAAVVAAAAAIPDQIQICGASSSNWFGQPRLWALTIAAPGAGKSPAQREMLAPLWKIHSELDTHWRDEVKALEAEQPQGKGPPKEIEKPPRPRVIIGDATLEALSEVLAENERGVLIATDEFDAWLGAMDQYRSGGAGRDRGEWLRLFDGGPHSIERVKRGTVFVPNWGVSILTATTPAAMRRLSRNLPEDGLIQRFLIVLARRQKIITNAPVRAEIKEECAQYEELVRRLHRMFPERHNGIVMFAPEAAARFDIWRAENVLLQEALGSIDSALEAHIAKYPTFALRLALTFHCARVAAVQNAMERDPAAYPVSLETLETALRFLRRESQHALALYLGRKGGSDGYELARNIARYVLARGPQENAQGVRRRDLIQRVTHFRAADEGTQSIALRLLEDLAWLRRTEGVYQKAQPTAYEVNPGLALKFASLSEREREHRRLARERIAEAAVPPPPMREREPGEDDE